MTAATVTLNGPAYPGIKFGVASAANDYTIDTGLSSCEGIVLTTSDDDEFASATSISGGTVTIGVVDDEGNAVTTARDIYFLAWGKN